VTIRLAAACLVAAAAGLIAAVGACSREPDPVVVADDGAAERVQALNRRVQELEAEVRASIVGTREAAELRKRFGEMERELAALREGLAGSGPAETAPSTGEPASGPTEVRPAYEPPTGSSGEVFSEEQIASFRRLQEEVDRRKEVEQRSERVKNQLKRASITLSPEHEKAVIDRTVAHEDAVRKLARGGFGRTEDERAEMSKKLEELRVVYEQDLRGIVPPESADKVVEALGRAFPGFVRRQVGDRTTRQR
jgi:hypothetical protein